MAAILLRGKARERHFQTLSYLLPISTIRTCWGPLAHSVHHIPLITLDMFGRKADMTE